VPRCPVQRGEEAVQTSPLPSSTSKQCPQSSPQFHTGKAICYIKHTPNLGSTKATKRKPQQGKEAL